MEEQLSKIKLEVNNIEENIGWNSLYQSIRMESAKYDYTMTEAKSPANRTLNRYRDVSPYDHSRVVLEKGPCSYINASFVKIEKANRNYILTQGALPQTSGHFWLMVWEQKSRAILMLNKIIEKDQIKCHQYWPGGVKNGDSDSTEFQDVGLKVHLKSEEDSRHFIIRTLIIEDLSTGNRREVLQFHYVTWPDFGVPSTPRAFLHFLQIVRDSNVLDSSNGPAVVHCSAGIGRSGTFCLVDSCLLMMEQGLEVNVKEILLEMRRFRTGLIQTADQLRFSYLAIVEGCQQLADGNKRFLPDPDEENGYANGSREDERCSAPLPPPRTTSSRPFDAIPTSDQYRDFLKRIGEPNGPAPGERPLPDLPPCTSSDDSSEVDSLDEESDDEEDPTTTTSTSYGLLDHVNPSNSITDERKSSVSEIENIAEDSATISTEPGSDRHHEESHKTNGLNEDSAALRRRKREATLEKIREIRTKQKESEAYQRVYRSPNPKRKRESTTKDD